MFASGSTVAFMTGIVTFNLCHQSFKNTVKRLVKQYQADLQTVKPPRVHQKRLDVLEVMCHAGSELTKQAQVIGERLNILAYPKPHEVVPHFGLPEAPTCMVQSNM